MTPTPDQTPERRDADCPICGKFARNWNSNNCKLSCSDTSCPGFKIDLHPNEWNHRPLENALRVRLAEAEKERDEWKEQAESVPYNTLANINDTCRTRGFMEGPSGRATEDRVIALAQAYDALRATNATLAERVRRMHQALTKMVTGFYGHHLCENDGRRCMACELAEETLGQLPPTPGAAVGKEGE